MLRKSGKQSRVEGARTVEKVSKTESLKPRGRIWIRRTFLAESRGKTVLKKDQRGEAGDMRCS